MSGKNGKKNGAGYRKRSIRLLQGVFDRPFFDLLKKNKGLDTFVLEGRPNLEAAGVSSRELLKRRITPTLITDNMAGFLFYKGWVKEVWLAYQVGEKDGAVCDVGALILAVLGKKHKAPVYLFPAGRKTRFIGRPEDLVRFKNVRIAPKGVRGYVPLADWVPKKYMTRIIK